MLATSPSGLPQRLVVLTLTLLALSALLLVGCGDPPPAGPLPGEPSSTQATKPGTSAKAAAQETTARATAATPAESPTTAEISRFTQVAVGERHACGLLSSGQVRCWGENNHGQLHVPSGVLFRQVSAGSHFSCGIRLDGSVECWGENDHEQLQEPEGEFTAIDVGWDHACAVNRDGVLCWGWDANGRTAAPVGPLFRTVGAGAEHSCGLTLADDLICWGNNPDGRADSQTGPFHDLAVGQFHTCMLRADGSALCQGDNRAGQADPPDTAFDQISAGLDHTCGINKAGNVSCWGGLAQSDTFAPINVELSTPPGTFTSVSAGWENTCATQQSGFAKCWEHSYGTTPISPYDRLALEHAYSDLPLKEPTDVFDWMNEGIAVVERLGTITLYANSGGPRILLDLTGSVNATVGYFGLLSAAINTGSDDSRFLYVYYISTEGKDPEVEAWARLSRFPVVNGNIAIDDELVLLELSLPKPAYGHYGFGHYGGAIRFGPDGMLYLSTGDADCFECPQTLDNLLGKIIRIDVRGASPGRPYQTPGDNPFLDVPDARPEIWALGFRNPWRMALDSETGDVWVGDVGHDSEEEVSIVSAGANLGWPAFRRFRLPHRG